MCHGVELSDTAGTQKVGDCPFCEKEQHFYVNPHTGQWDCKHCGRNGNIPVFLAEMAKEYSSTTTVSDFQRLSKQRNLPPKAFYGLGMGWSGAEWMLPAFSERGTVRDIRRWNGTKTMATDGCQLQLYGLRELHTAKPNSIVWVCEGEWDYIALRYLLQLCGRTEDVLVAVPGAAVMKQDWIDHFKKMQCRLCYDNDDPGDDGSLKAGGLLADVANAIEYLCWPESLPVGWDLRDMIGKRLAAGDEPEQVLSEIEALLSHRHRRSSLPENEGGTDGGTPLSGDDQISTWEEVVAVFQEWLELDSQFTDGLAVSLAVAMSNTIPGDPLWLYLIGPPGSGKTVILMSLKESVRVFFRSTLTPGSLISGFNVHPDPSLLPKFNGKTAVFKDATELLCLYPQDRDKIYGILRGAWDGQVNKGFGNGVNRDYTNLHFGLLMGVTPAVHGDSQASMGERFLKYEMHEDPTRTRAKIEAAIDNIAKEAEMEAALCDVVRRFLLRQVEELPELPGWARDRIVALTQLVTALRAKVDREVGGDRDIKYKPSSEIGTRVGKSLAKLAKMLAIVFETEIDERVMRIIERVSFHTMIDFHLDIVRSIMLNGSEGATVSQLCRATGMPSFSLMKRIEDLQLLRIVQKEKINTDEYRKLGTKPNLWQVTPTVRDIWMRANQPKGKKK
jgi:ribosomal protein L37AE/L43A